MKRISIALALAVVMAIASTGTALAGADQAQKEAAGWGCGSAVDLPDGHCISPGTVKNFDKLAARGGTFQLLVFDEEGRFVTAEIATFKNADDRPCPHDDESPDRTYWDFVAETLWVCHHRSE